MSAARPVHTLRVLLEGLVDYAGLFPPAGLPMHEAVANYAAYRDSPESWALGRFVVPVARLDELAAEASRYAGAAPQPWRISALAGEGVEDDATRIGAFNAAHLGGLVVDAVEVRASTPDAIGAAARALGELAVFAEIPLDPDPDPLLREVKRDGAFKTTAGLHHPVRGEHPLTYSADAPSAPMFGFLNLFLAAAFARVGATEPTLAHLLEERDPSAFRFADDAVRWRNERLSVAQLAASREKLALAFGSCSFREPVDDLRQLALL
jgi:hypothetical protein